MAADGISTTAAKHAPGLTVCIMHVPPASHGPIGSGPMQHASRSALGCAAWGEGTQPALGGSTGAHCRREFLKEGRSHDMMLLLLPLLLLPLELLEAPTVGAATRSPPATAAGKGQGGGPPVRARLRTVPASPEMMQDGYG